MTDSSNETNVIAPRAAMRLIRKARDEEHTSQAYSHHGATNNTQRQLKNAITRESGGPYIKVEQQYRCVRR